jgi:hypothetical protein
MRDLLDIYVRSLTEQEQQRDAPENRQDLGTFMCWLLERHGYDIHLRAYQREGTAYVSQRGRIQWGVDILASKADPNGVDRAYRFVLKRGDFGRAEFQPAEPGSMVHDLWLAAGRDPAEDARHASDLGSWERVTVVAVHNGSLKTEEIGQQVKQTCQQIEHKMPVKVEWWQAEDLVAMALAPPADPHQGTLADKADASLFPPSMRAFSRLALDSLQRDPAGMGGKFDFEAVDRLLEESLPLGRSRSGHGPGVRLGEGFPLEARHVRRIGAELSLFAGMVEVECRRVAQSNTLPPLETIARILCRLMEHLRRLSPSDTSGHKRALRRIVDSLLERYIGQANLLRLRLEPLLDHSYGLAMPGDGERLDYSLRTLRLAGHLAIAGLGCLDVEAGPHRPEASQFADALERLVAANEAAVLSPVTDDQIIELAAIWMLWLRLGRQDAVARTAHRWLERMWVREQLGLPGPSLWTHARIPMAPEEIHTLVTAHLMGKDNEPGFLDTGTTILPLTVTLCHALGRPLEDRFLAPLQPVQRSRVPGELPQQVRVLYAQSWRPPSDAADEWYCQEIRYRGKVKVYDDEGGVAALSQAFRHFHEDDVPSSPAATVWKRPVIDWLAWMVWRTPPPMGLFLTLLPQIKTDEASATD